MTTLEHAQWRREAEGHDWGVAVLDRRILALLDALDVSEAALADAKARNQWLGDAS